MLLLLDDTNCCQGVLEFLLPEGVEYPEVGTTIMIVGNYSVGIDTHGEYPYLDVTEYVL